MGLELAQEVTQLKSTYLAQKSFEVHTFTLGGPRSSLLFSALESVRYPDPRYSMTSLASAEDPG